jgi:peptide/nickel transport system ATP-binding protein
MPDPMLDVQDLAVRFRRREDTVQVVRGVSFSLQPGEVLTILGESGSGKSVTLRALLGLLPDYAETEGSALVAGKPVLGHRRPPAPGARGMAMVFQEPMSSLDPVYTIGRQITETLQRHDGSSRRAARARAIELLELVRIPSPDRRLESFPHELSGGMRQRAMIALALACSPKVLLADEPTTALDVTVQMQILLLLRQLQRDLGMAIVFVTHDMGVAAEISDDVAVMYAGRFVEIGTAHQVLRTPSHPYTIGLMASTVHGGRRGRRLNAIPGSPPSLAALPPGCPFAPPLRRRRTPLPRRGATGCRHAIGGLGALRAGAGRPRGRCPPGPPHYAQHVFGMTGSLPWNPFVFDLGEWANLAG